MRSPIDGTATESAAGAAALPNSGTGILPVVKARHRQDADATSPHRVETCIKNALSKLLAR